MTEQPITFVVQLHGLQVVAYRSDADVDLHRVLYGNRFDPPAGMTERNLVGYAQFDFHPDDYLYATAVMVDSNFQRQRIATAMYDLIEAKYGTPVCPSPTLQTPEAKAFWTNRQLGPSVNRAS